MKKREASALIYLIFFITVILLFCAFAVDLSLVLTSRAELQNATETAALAGASGISAGNATTNAQNVLKILNADLQKHASGNTIKTKPDKVYVEANTSAPTFFLAFAGISNIKLVAKSAAIKEDLEVFGPLDSSGNTRDSIIWANKKTFYKHSLFEADSKFQLPIGKFAFSSIDYKNFGTGVFQSLGAAGYIMFKLPAPIMDKQGNDLEIVETGDAKDGYKVYAGLDKNPANPYLSSTNQGDGIKWTDITCTGSPSTYLKDGVFYGEGKFDIGKSCSTTNGISMAKYIKIVDDNKETAFYKDGDFYYILGDSSTSTAGADIKSVKVLNYTRLILPKDF